MSELTAKELNNVIVNLRDVVGGAAVRASRKLIAQMRRYERARNEKKRRRIQKYEAEMAAMKKLKKDDVSKFALVNVKSLAEFKFTNETPVEEVALYKVATEGSLTAAVDEIRKTYPNWHQEIPFILQRLGLRSKDRKSKELEEDQKNANDVADSEGIDKSLLEGGLKPEVKMSTNTPKAKVQKLLKKEKKQKLPPPLPLPKRTVVATMEKVRRGEAVVKRINLKDAETLVKSSSEDEGDSEAEQKNTGNLLIAKHSGKGGFFVGQLNDESGGTEDDSERETSKGSQKIESVEKTGFKNSNIASGVQKTDSHSFKRKQMDFEDAEPANSQDTKDAKQLHPSWSAKQMKFKQEAELMKAAPQNKRIKFNE